MKGFDATLRGASLPRIASAAADSILGYFRTSLREAMQRLTGLGLNL